MLKAQVYIKILNKATLEFEILNFKSYLTLI